MTDNKTCSGCKYFGEVYDNDPFGAHHLCGKKQERQADYFEAHPRTDLLQRFRIFFDASPKQKACKYYEGSEVKELVK